MQRRRKLVPFSAAALLLAISAASAQPPPPPPPTPESLAHVDTYYGKHLYRIDCSSEPFRIKSKRSVLAMDMLYPGKLTIII